MLEVCRHLAVEVLVCQYDCAVDKVSENGHELAVVAGLEILP